MTNEVDMWVRKRERPWQAKRLMLGEGKQFREWLHESGNEKALLFTHEGVNEIILFSSASGLQVCETGDWVVIKPSGDSKLFMTIKNDDFDALFEKVAD